MKVPNPPGSGKDIAEGKGVCSEAESEAKRQTSGWYKKVIEIEGDSWGTNSYLPYLFQQCEMYEKSTEASFLNTKHEIYSVIADNYYYLGKIQEGIEWLNKIISESTDKELLQHTTSVKEGWTKIHNKSGV